MRERHNLNHNKGGPPTEQGDVVLIIQSDEHNRGKWNILKHCGKADQRKRGERLMSEIEGRLILSGMRYSTIVSYGAIM